MLHNGHFVLGQSTGLVGADGLGTAQGFHGGELPDDGLIPAHLGNAHGKNDGNYRSQTLGNGCYRQRNCHHEGVQNARAGDVGVGTQHIQQEDEHTDANDQEGQDLTELTQLTLQGGLFVLCLRQRIGDLAHFRIHAGAGDDSAATTVNHGGTHVDHVFSVTQRNVLLLAQLQNLIVLGNGNRFAGKGSLFDLHGVGSDDAAVCGNSVAGFQNHNVTGNQFIGTDGDHFAVTKHLGGGGGNFLQSGNGFFRFTFLHHAQYRVDDDHGHDDDDIGKAFAGVNGSNAGDDGSHDQDDDHGIGELLQELLDHRHFSAFCKFVRSVAFQSGSGLLTGKTQLSYILLRQNLGFAYKIFFQVFFLPSHLHGKYILPQYGA